jgi:cytochrome c-type biogenesis protein CcmH
MKRLKSWFICLAGVAATALSLSLPAKALQPDELLADPALEARARAISAGLRCLVCQNQSIDDSDAPLARDLRVLVRQRLAAGDTDSQIEDFVVARYGEFMLLRPRFAPHTLLLWLAAPAVLLAAILAILMACRRGRRSAPPAAALSAQEKRRVEELLDQG